MTLHTNMINDAEELAREELLVNFKSELEALVAKANAQCDEIGGTFRSHGIRHSLRGILSNQRIEV